MRAGGPGEPTGRLADAIAHDFGGLESFKAQFEVAGSAIFASGWVWLVRAHQNGGMLRIVTTLGNGNPMMQGHFPILCNDVWEHAYYLKHADRRADYLRGWWPVVDWEEAARRFVSSDHTSKQNWVTSGELLLPA
jgi:Fe-Mn family superoxide dismutase